jgi:hypothetical protein
MVPGDEGSLAEGYDEPAGVERWEGSLVTAGFSEDYASHD